MAVTKEPVTLPKLRHLEGCPENRVEAFRHDSPRRKVDDEGKEFLAYTAMSVVRCGDCGEQLVIKDQGKLIHDYRRSLNNGNQS